MGSSARGDQQGGEVGEDGVSGESGARGEAPRGLSRAYLLAMVRGHFHPLCDAPGDCKSVW